MSHLSGHRLVFFGTDAFSIPSLIRLLGGAGNVVAAVTKPDRQTGRGQELTMPAVKRLTISRGIPVFQPTALADLKPQLDRLYVDAGVVVSYGKIIPPSIISLFPRGLINVHASLLPAYRGASPIEAAILNGDAQTGVSLMRIEPGLDTGPVYAATELPLVGTETRQELYERLAYLGADLLARHLSDILDGRLTPTPQDNHRVTTTGLITKQQGHIDWTQPAAVIERQIRAYLGWPGSHTTLAGTELIITAAHVSQSPQPSTTPGTPFKTTDGRLAVACGIGSLIIDHLKPAGKRDMTAREFLAGHPLA